MPPGGVALYSLQTGSECAIGLIAEGQGCDMSGHFKLGMIFEKRLNLFHVFIGLNRASRINDAAAGLEARDGVFEDISLGENDLFNVVWLEAPADIDATTDDAGVGAGDIEQDGIECAMPCGGSGLGPIVNADLCLAGVESCEILFESWQAFFVGVRAHEIFGGAHRGGDEKCFSARRGAGVEDVLSRLWREQLDRMTRGRILNVDGSALNEIVWKRTLDAIKSQSVFYGFARDVGGRREGVDAAKCFCRQIVPLHEG